MSGSAFYNCAVSRSDFLCSYLVFEFLECNLYEIMKDRQKYFAESVLRNYMYAKPLPLPSYSPSSPSPGPLL